MLQLDASRRQFLKGTGSLVVTFGLAGPLGALAAKSAAAKTVAGDEVGAYLQIAKDGIVTVYTGKCDLGTGIRTALSQMAAEELDVPMRRVKVVEGDTELCADQGPTWASLSVQAAGVQIRQAAATARKALVQMAAQRLGVAADQLEVRNGVVHAPAGKRVSYGQLVGGKELELKLDKEAPLKDPAKYKVVGKPLPRPEVAQIVTGTFRYMQDFRVPGMAHARVVFPPADGATLQSVDEGSVRSVPGLVKVVRIKDFLAVVAESEWGAITAAKRLKATWSAWQGLPDQKTLFQHVRATPVAKDEVEGKVGDAKAALGSAAKRLNATYEFAIHTHGSIGPSCAVADVKGGKATVWSASQSPFWLRKELAGMLKLPEASVHVVYLAGAGCYGRNGHEDAAAEAALISREVGRPVRVQWMRADEHGWDPKGPPHLVDLRGGLDAGGNIVAWDFESWIPQQTALTDHPPLTAGHFAGLLDKEGINPGRIQNNAVPSYGFPNQLVTHHRLATTPFRPSWIRTPGRMQNVYAIEVFMDELAASAGVDPVEFRLRHLKDARGAETLRAAAKRARWETRPANSKAGRGPVATGRGFAYAKYENRTYVAGVAEVTVNRSTGAIRCTRFVVAHDCGLIVNPDGLRNQIDGNIIQTVSRTLKEELKFDRSRVTSVDWASYPILTFPEVPEVQIELLDRPNAPPWGAGEPAAVLPPPAISNAIFDATGVRLRTVPFTPERFLAAQKSAA